MSEITDITATLLRRKLRPALKSVEAGARVRITRHNKVVAALIGPADYDKLTGAASSDVPKATKTVDAVEITPSGAAIFNGGLVDFLPPPQPEEETKTPEKLITAL